MLKCINCGAEFNESINMTSCPKCGTNPLLTQLYSTTIKNFSFEPTPTQYDFTEKVYLKREDKNPFGTFKDRKSFFILRKTHPGSKFALASSGNQAISFAKTLNLKYHNTYLYVSPKINEKKLEILKRYYDEITFVDHILTTEQLTRFEKDRWNITNGMDPIGASAYYSLAMELEPYNFDNIVVPMGSGELYSSLAAYFKLLRKKEINIIPVQCNLKDADAIRTTYVPTTPFLKKFSPLTTTYGKEAQYSVGKYATKYKCEFSSAVVFEALKYLNLKGKTCLIITGIRL